MEKKEYIECGMLMYRLGYYYDHTSGDPNYAYGVALKEVRAAPAADVVEVVRCKDCVCWAGNEYWENRASHGKCYCPDVKISMGAVLFTKPDDYCSHGERKEE
jgi:hypothetical protein